MTAECVPGAATASRRSHQDLRRGNGKAGRRDRQRTAAGRFLSCEDDWSTVCCSRPSARPIRAALFHQLVIYAEQQKRGRPLSDRAMEMGFRIGLGLVLMLMVFATYNDILHLAAQWTAS